MCFNAVLHCDLGGGGADIPATFIKNSWKCIPIWLFATLTPSYWQENWTILLSKLDQKRPSYEEKFEKKWLKNEAPIHF